MKTVPLFLALMLALPAVASSPAATAPPAEKQVEPAPAISDPSAFAAALDDCTAARHAAPHPFIKGFEIEHAIAGESEGSCAYSQTMPGGMRMECRLSGEGRSGLAAEFREQAAGRMSGGTGKSPAWTAECEIVTKDGARSPMGGG